MCVCFILGYRQKKMTVINVKSRIQAKQGAKTQNNNHITRVLKVPPGQLEISPENTVKVKMFKLVLLQQADR